MNVVDGDRLSPVTAPQEQVLLTALALAGGEPVSTGQMIDTIWGDDPPASASAALKALVHRVRRRHGRELLVTSASGYRLGPGIGSDFDEAQALVDRGTAALADGNSPEAVQACQAALALLRGEAPPALAATTTGLRWERQIAELRARAEDLSLEARLAAGAGEELVASLEAALETDPLAERNWERLMIALYRSGRQAAALGAFARARAVLVELAGVEPGPGLVAVEQQILGQDPALLHGAAPDLNQQETQSEPASTDPAEAVADLDWFHSVVPFSGRNNELATLSSVLDDSIRNRRRHIVLLSGDAGMGKTRLAGELANHAASTGATVIYGACDPGVAGGYRPFAVALDRLSALFPAVLAGRDLSLVSRIAPMLKDRYQLSDDDPEAVTSDDDQRVHSALTRLLDDLANDTGLVIVLDDLHWASAPTLALLRHIANDASPAPITIIGTYRPRDLTDASPLSPALADLHRHQRCTPIEVGRLTTDDLRSLIGESAGQAVPDDLIEGVEHATGGNPYLVVSTLRHLTDANLIVRRNQRWELAEGALATLPAGIRHLITRQLALLSKDATALLHVAAVAGLTFSLEVTAKVADLGTDAALGDC